MTSKFDKFLKASWNAICSVKMRQDARGRAVLESALRNAQVSWGGLRRGIRNFKEVLGKDKKTLVTSLARRPGWAADYSPRTRRGPPRHPRRR